MPRITTFYPIEEQEEEEEEENEYNECNYNSREVTPNYASTNSNNPNNYITLPFANATYLTIITAKLTYQPISGMYNYLTVVNASNIYLSIIDASNTYLQIMDASNNYLQITDASNIYLKIMDASNNYLQIIDASNNYLQITDASNNYLQIIDASTNYLKIIDASTNYLKITDASNNYLQITDASNNYLQITDASTNYLKIIDASTNYLKITDASNNYLKIIDASNTYLQIMDASNNYLQIIDASTNYLKIIDASNNYLSRTGNPTSAATLTTFNGKISVLNATICADVLNNKLGISTSITDVSQIGIGTVVVGSTTSNNAATNAVIVGTQIYGSNNSVAIGNLCGSTQQATQTNNISIGRLAYSNASNCVTIGSGATNYANNCVAIGANALTTGSATQCVAIGYNCQATLPNQIVLGTSTETVYCPGNPASGTTTPNTCLVLSSNVTLNSQTVAPTTGQLGYTMNATLATSGLIAVTPTTTTYAPITLNVGTWLITGVVNVTSTLTINSIFTISMNTSTTHNSKQLIVYQSFLSPSYLTTSFNYSNIIYNTTNSQTWNILISVDANPSSSISTSSTGAYINATRIA